MKTKRCPLPAVEVKPEFRLRLEVQAAKDGLTLTSYLRHLLTTHPKVAKPKSQK